MLVVDVKTDFTVFEFYIIQLIVFFKVLPECPSTLHEAATDCICSALYSAEVRSYFS